jgi:hypothetical protein
MACLEDPCASGIGRFQSHAKRLATLMAAPDPLLPVAEGDDNISYPINSRCQGLDELSRQGRAYATDPAGGSA